MKRFILFIMMFLVVGCGICKKVQYVPVQTKIDSVYVEKIVERLDTIKFELPADTVYMAAKVDSSHLETEISISDAWVDSCSVLHHRLANKAGKSLEKEIVYKDKVIEKRVEVEKEVPVEVEVPVKFVPGYYKWINGIFWGLIGLFVIFIVLKVYFKIKI